MERGENSEGIDELEEGEANLSEATATICEKVIECSEEGNIPRTE